MKKYYLSYALFILPALIVSIFFKNESSTSIALQWFFAFFMLFGFFATTYFAAYVYPRESLSLILIYTGINFLVFYCFYRSVYGTALYLFLRDFGGALSYVPLGIFVDTFTGSRSNIEVYVILIAAACMLAGYLSALIKRRVKPYPYSPRIG